MKTIYILLTRSGTFLSHPVYQFTGSAYTHASIAFDEDLSCLYQGSLADLPQRRKMELGEPESITAIYLGIALGLVKTGWKKFF